MRQNPLVTLADYGSRANRRYAQLAKIMGVELVRFDICSEYMERISISSLKIWLHLLGYVGFGPVGLLSDAGIKNPIVLVFVG